MGHRGHNRQWAREAESLWAQHRSGSRGGPWGWETDGPGGPGGRRGRPGPPPWLAGLFDLGPADRGRGPRVRRGDVRAAILDVLRAAQAREEQVNGYQVIQEITERSNNAWRPSPGSVYPTIQQLQDEGLVEVDDERNRRAVRLTAAGQEYVEQRAAELAAVWAPFEAADRAETGSGAKDVKKEIGQVMSAVWQIVTTGSDAQRRAAIDVLVETRRKLYGILADGDPADPGDTATTDE